MADLAASAVTRNYEYVHGDATGKKLGGLIEFTLVLTGQGDATDKILASALGLSKILEGGILTASDDSIGVVAFPSYDGSTLFLKAAGTNAPGTYSGTFKGVIRGVNS